MPLTESPYLTAAQVRTRISRGSPSLSSDEFDDDFVEEVVAEFEELVERDRGVAFTPREETEVLRIGSMRHTVELGWPMLRSIESLTINGTTISSSAYRYNARLGSVTYDFPFDPDYPPTFVYRHGYDAPESRLLRACALYVERVAALDRGGATRDVSRQGFDGGSTSFVQPDPMGWKVTGFVDVDRIIATLPNHRPLVG